MHHVKLLLFIFFVISQDIAFGQKSAPGIIVVCPGSNEDSHTHVPVQRFTDNARTAQTASFNVEYIGFSEQAKAAFQYAVNIWQTRISSPIPIKIRATWAELESGVLGSAGAEQVWQNFEGAPKRDTWYPVALAEKLSRSELNSPEDADIVANFNSNANWYLGTDGNTPAGRTDFVTVVLHEIAHGLGFVSTMEIENNVGSWGISGSPIAFDHHIENGNGQQLINTNNFSRESAALRNQLTSNNIFFNGPIVGNRLSQKPKLFAPSPYDVGSSISHLDENTYPIGTLNSLMTPRIANAEAIHEPGPIVMEMFAEIGWESTFIDVSLNKDVESLTNPITLRANIISDIAINPQSLIIHYSTNNFATSNQAQMAPTQIENQYAVTIPATITPAIVSYYILVSDIYGRSFSSPTNAPGGFHQIRVGPDLTPPVIVHEPIEIMIENEMTVNIRATVTDNTGIRDVTVEYFINDNQEASFRLTATGGDLYVGNFIFPPGRIKAGDIIRYRLVAIDIARNANTTINPPRDYHRINVRKIIQPVVTYINNFSEPTFDFTGTNFRITTSSGFNNPAIHSNHPYDNPGNAIYQLLIPIVVARENAIMRYREIALVEPGETGSVFGEQEFFDYVVIEASNDEGLTWQPLMPGYDSRKHPVWLQRYNSNVVEDNSLAVGDPSLFRADSIDLRQTFSAGDTILIRFRLYSDQEAYGWGWAIDDLNIQGDPIQLQPGLTLRPNPSNGHFFMEIPLEVTNQDVEISIFSSQGQNMFSEIISNPSQNFIREYNLSDSPPGIYIVRFKTESFSLSRRLLILK